MRYMMRSGLISTVQAIATVAMFLGLWEITSRSGWVSRALFPPPTQVLAALVEWAKDGGLVRDLWASLWKAYTGLAIGAAIGVPAGILAGRVRAIRDCVLPLILLFRPIPPVAIIPLVIIWFGIGTTSKLSATAFAVFFPVFTAAYQGARNLPDSYLWAARSVGLSPVAILFRIVLPGTLNVTMAGLRVGLATAFLMIYVNELAGSASGVGYQIALMHLNYRIDRMMAALVVLGTFAALSDSLLSYGVSYLFPWLGKQS